MNIVILHCHFERGGVTQVVENHVSYLAKDPAVERIVLVSGNRAGGLSRQTLDSVEQVFLESLGYDGQDYSEDENRRRAGEIAERLEVLLQEHKLDRSKTVLHWHNHSLGKNTSSPIVIDQLAKRGWHFLLQVHDFAEDNRPDNYRRLIHSSGAAEKEQLDRFLYPRHERIRYAALTRGDVNVLETIGCPTDLIFNSVQLPDGEIPDPNQARSQVNDVLGIPGDCLWTLYPVRGIRRKNIGEWLLLTRLLPEHGYSGLTLQPTTEVEQQSYLRWQRVAKEVAPRAIFDVGHHDGLSFATNLVAADKVLSTSVAEGFGMAFLEPWLAGREVIARRLPGVTADFEEAGVKLSKFYDSIPIPGERAWLKSCREESAAVQEEAFQVLPPAFRPQALADMTADQSIDFASLTPDRQIEVLTRMHHDPGFEQEVLSRSASLVANLASPANPKQLTENGSVIASQYGIHRVGDRLTQSYRQTLAGSPVDLKTGEGGHAIDQVNRNRPFYPCRTEVFSDA